ncbi:MAG: hypothetical protein JWP89_4848 [Schlesneria sp.]|nr:hypothetical protein [Schlesneria sp.]
MGTVFRKIVTRPLPKGAELYTRQGQQFARWKPAKGRTKTAKVTTGKDGSPRILEESGTYIAKYRDGSGHVCEVSTGCRDEDAARSVLGKLERRAELVKSEVMSSAEAATADHQQTSLTDHFAEYLQYLQARETSSVRVANMKRQFSRVSEDCCFRRLSDLDAGKLTKWLLHREAEEMSAATRNGYRETLVMFSNWCCSGTKPRLSANPFSTVPKANVKADRRRHRRAMIESELVKLLEVARWRPLAEFGRKSVPVDSKPNEATGKRKRSNWTKATLTLEGLEAAVERARGCLAKNPELTTDLERLGWERALIYKTLVLTGLRKNELASLTVGQLELDGSMPFVILNACDEKNRQGSTIPLRADLANDLRNWLSHSPKPATLRLHSSAEPADTNRPLFTVPAGLVRILDRDLSAAGIKKTDERGRTLDVHALRHSFGTLLSKGGVAPRTAQAAMRHSSIDLTMNVYTDPKLLDVHGALNSLPSLDMNPSENERQTVRATGTDGRAAQVPARHSVNSVAPDVAPNTGQAGQTVSFAVVSSADGDDTMYDGADDENPNEPSEKASPAVFASKASGVGMTGFEPAASTSRT